MTLWRISNYADLKGIGGLKYAARWHNRGIAIVYLSEHPALTMLEILVHGELDASRVPRHFQLLEVEFRASKLVAELDVSILNRSWEENLDLTRSIGDEWLQSASSLLLRVPSALVPKSYNYLMNPRHPDATKASIIAAISRPFDGRLVK